MSAASRPAGATAPAAGLADRALAGDRAALARAISLVDQRDPRAREILGAAARRLGRALVVGVTGPPGAGKSTLVSALVRAYRVRARTVGVVAVDPSSPISGGAVLGDRVRMAEHTADPGVFVRSLGSRGHAGGLSATTARVADLMDAAGFDVVLVETVGAGQAEVSVASVADVRLVVCVPGLGDGVQALKAGILEIADVLVVNKADLPLADRVHRELEAAVALREAGRRVPVLDTVATAGEGVDALIEAVDSAREASGGGKRDRLTAALAEAAGEALARHLRHRAAERLESLAEAVRAGGMELDEAARSLAASGTGAP